MSFKLARIIVIGFLLVSGFTGCSSDISDGKDGVGTTGKDGVATLIVMQNEAIGTHCAYGGTKITLGLDTNNNVTLDLDEITSTKFTCNGLNGTDGINGTKGYNTLIIMTDDTTTCPNGGQQIEIGLDKNRNDILDSNELNATKFICNGADGTEGQDGGDGSNGFNTLIIMTEANVTICPNGGQKVVTGLDTSRDNILDTDEVNSTKYICGGTDGLDGPDGTNGQDGTNGYNTLIIMTDNTTICPNGGQKIDTGLDKNRNDILDSDELNSTKYICNGADGTDMVILPDDTFTMVLDVNRSDVKANWKIEGKVIHPAMAAVVQQGHSGTFVINGDFITYLKTNENNSSDKGVIKVVEMNQTKYFVIDIDTLYWQQISAGGQHMMALKSDGTLWSWGANVLGQLGDGTFTERLKPVQEKTKANDWVSVSAGYFHSSAIKQDGTLWLWGKNEFGQLGDGTKNYRAVPTQEAKGISNWRSVSSGYVHTAAITDDGALWLWGKNNYGQLGNNTVQESVIPVQEVTMSSWRSVSLGAYQSLAIKDDGSLWGWGRNSVGQLGDGTTIDRWVPTQEASGSFNWKSVREMNRRGIALKDDGTLWGWGANEYGQLGDGTLINRTSPVQETSHLSNWIKIAAGQQHTLALKNDGTLWAWGRNDNGQLGDGTRQNRLIPVQESTHGFNWSSISSREYYSIALKDDGTFWTWGSNKYGQFGNGTKNNDTLVPLQESSVTSQWKSVSSNATHVAAIKKDGTLWSWGKNDQGQLGDGTTSLKTYPTQESTHTSLWREVRVGGAYTVAIKEDGTLWSWGDNSSGQLGDGTLTKQLNPIQESTKASDWVSVGARSAHTVAIKSDGTLWAWGRNVFGQLGNGNKVNQSTPVQESNASVEWQSVCTGFSHTVAIKQDGTLWAWGRNFAGQLGDASTIDKINPTQEDSQNILWKNASCGNNYTVALKHDGSIWAWGYNGYGQLGDNSLNMKLVPIQEFTKATDWESVSAGHNHTIALKKDGTLWAWGNNVHGQLGDKTMVNRRVPVQENTLAKDWSINAYGQGDLHSVVIKSDGTLWSWGANEYGQLGIAIPLSPFMPQKRQ